MCPEMCLVKSISMSVETLAYDISLNPIDLP